MFFSLLLTCLIGFSATPVAEHTDYIKWISFEVPLAVLNQAYAYDVGSQDEDVLLDFVPLLAYGAAKNWGKFNGEGKCADIDEVARRLRDGELMYEITADLKLYDFYLKAYHAVLGGFVGEYVVEGQRKYGLQVFSPIAKGYGYGHSDDFGNSRSYGYNRRHQGNDLFGSPGTPIIAVEDGIVEAMGWNQYGGWRVGIRSHDNKRYYYYAHLRKDKPYAAGLEVGNRVNAGDVIGYLGATGYSHKENVSNIKQPHLHFGLQIIFDESQKDGINQIWIDTYNIIKFLKQNQMQVVKNEEGEWVPAVRVENLPRE